MRSLTSVMWFGRKYTGSSIPSSCHRAKPQEVSPGTSFVIYDGYLRSLLNLCLLRLLGVGSLDSPGVKAVHQRTQWSEGWDFEYSPASLQE